MAWADLPVRCLVRVLRNLLNIRDRAVFSVVCRQWREVAPSYPDPPRWSPWLVMPSTAATTFFSLASRDTRPLRLPIFASGARLCGSFPGGWLLADSRRTRGGNYALFNLLTGEVVDVPGYLIITNPLGELELPVHVHAAAFSAAPSAPSYDVAAILHGYPAIAFWRPGEIHWRPPRQTAASCDQSWRDLMPAGKIEDVLYHAGKVCEGFHVLTDSESLLVCKPVGTDAGGALTTSLAFYDFGNHQPCNPVAVGLGHGHTVARYLVESGENLLMVARFVSPQQRTVAFGVFVLSYDKLLRGSSSAQSLTYVPAIWRNATLEDVGCRKIILGRGCSVALEGTDPATASPFGICFLDDGSLVLGEPYPCGDTGVALPVVRRIVRPLPQEPSSSDCSPWIWFFPGEVTFRSIDGHVPTAVTNVCWDCWSLLSCL